MAVSRASLLCRYGYTASDQLRETRTHAPGAQQHFYRNQRRVTQIDDQAQYTLLNHLRHLLAQRQWVNGLPSSTLLATDVCGSLLLTSKLPLGQSNYTPYGYSSQIDSLPAVPGFNGEWPDPLTDNYLLGNYRNYRPQLMRFIAADSASPFAQGGLNSYAYCAGDPVNQQDPSGHGPISRLFKLLKRPLGSSTRVDDDLIRAEHSAAPAASRPSRSATAQPARLIGANPIADEYYRRVVQARQPQHPAPATPIAQSDSPPAYDSLFPEPPPPSYESVTQAAPPAPYLQTRRSPEPAPATTRDTIRRRS
ncbi:hypothetical protein DCO48_00955 [Pseudomonas sp. SDI]|uniref:RHS repeat-associated core domain-containing protein n=1 Tax=Pseudomonas sp. SDI TaxID=2170734 RepID=UPI000DE5DD2C|nr:RHS repeat-associated core domain-containing protein [Pseudomonas sp. SDI]PWB36047.1 hypothetical protein DCO48_00955 [Pseudomonas sp. SDI]